MNILLSGNEETNGAGKPQVGGDDGDMSKAKKKQMTVKLDEEQ